jgi:hypothetical protein
MKKPAKKKYLSFNKSNDGDRFKNKNIMLTSKRLIKKF